MHDIAKQFPEYGFDQHMGYGTKYHLEALQKYGVTVHHRKSFAPVKELL
jgi:ribonuclease HII